MVDALVGHGRVCTAASDIAPRRDDIARKDALGLTERDLQGRRLSSSPTRRGPDGYSTN